MHIREILRRLLMGKRYAKYWKQLRSQAYQHRDDNSPNGKARRDRER